MEDRAHLPGEGLELVDGRGTVDVAAHHHHFLAVALAEQLGQLRRAGGLARTLQAGHEHHHRWLRGEIQGLVGLAHDLDEFLVHHLDERLARREALGDLLAEGPLTHVVCEGLDHRQGDVGLEQGDADLPDRFTDGLVGEPTLAAQLLDRPGKALGKLFEHG